MEIREIAWVVLNYGMPNPNVPGWPNGDVWWIATIMAESSGDPTAKKGTHFGLTQMSEQHAGIHPPGSPAMPDYEEYMYVVPNNLAGAKSLFGVQGVAAWKASELGRRKWKARAEIAVTLPKKPDSLSEAVGVPISGKPDPLTAIADAIGGVVNVLDDARKWITNPDNWVRIVQVGGGIALALIAIAVVIKPPIKVDVQ